MNAIITIIQIFSSLITIISFLGFFGFYEKVHLWGIQIKLSQASIIFLIITILSLFFGNKLKRNYRETKIQLQFGGRGNKQKMN